MKITPLTILTSLTLLTLSCSHRPHPTIYYPPGADAKIVMAAQEIQRYVYLRTGTLMAIRSDSVMGTGADAIFLWHDSTLPAESYRLCRVSTYGSGSDATASLHKVVKDYYDYYFEYGCAPDSMALKAGDNLNDQGLLGEPSEKGRALAEHGLLHIAGGDPQAVLYGAYAFAEKLGVRYYLHGDVIPDKKIRFRIPELNETWQPQFSIRGIQPFHDFPEGPDWWTLDDYKTYLNQLVRMRMNFIGFHCYPEGGVGPEPLVWIGPEEAIQPDGSVSSAYPARHFLTTSGTWGYTPKLTGSYSHGLGQLFPEDAYGASYLDGIQTWPETADDENALFKRSADFFGEVFAYARSLGIKTCIGTETPLKIPSKVKESYPHHTAEEMYRGMFEWVKKNYGVDYYWFWTPEDWTWGGNSNEELKRTIDDMGAAMKAAEAVEAPFQLATCGWVLGPVQNRAMFDEYLPKSWPMSCINQQVGFTPVDPGFSRISERPLWAIPWMEDDPALTIPQFWAGRMRADAQDALDYGCTGLIGIHWRTRPLAMNVSALAKAAWTEASGIESNPDSSWVVAADSNFLRQNRDLPVQDFYLDWATAEFGSYVDDSLAALFNSLDGQEISINAGGGKKTRLPRPADWVGGPGGVVVDTTPWDIRKQDYAFIERMEPWRENIRRAGNRDRFDYWLHQFKYLRAYAKFACTLGELQQSTLRAQQLPDSLRGTMADDLIRLRMRLMENQTEALTQLLNYISTPGDLGTVANWQQHIQTIYIDKPSDQLQQLIGDSLPPACCPSPDTLAVERIIVPTVRQVLDLNEDLALTIILPGIKPVSAVMKYRMLGKGAYHEQALEHISRAVYQVTLPHDLVPGSFEYYLEVKDKNGTVHRWPATAGKINQTLIRR